MEVIFTKSIPNIAVRGDAKNVKRGYFRNFLMPRGLAIRATAGLKSQYGKVREKEMMKKEEMNAHAREFLARLSDKVFTLQAKVTKKGTLYRAVSAAQVVSAIGEQAKVEIEASHVHFEHPVKTTGKHEVTIKLTPEVSANISLEVSSA